MARIPYVDPASAPEPVREVLDKLAAPLNIFRLMAHAETNFRPLLRLGSSILSEQRLSAALRELAILRVSRLSAAEYEWVQHVPIAQAVGVEDEQIEALAADRIDAPCFDEVERTVLAFTTDVVREVGTSDECFAELASRLSSQEIVELILAIGFYMTVARLMVATKIDLEPPAGVKVLEQLR